MFFPVETFGVEVEPVFIRRAVPVFEHVMELPEPARGVVEYAIENHAHVLFMGFIEQRPQGAVAAQHWVHVVVVEGVVAVIRSGGKDRVEIERRDPEILDVVEPFSDPIQVASLIPVGGGGRVPGFEADIGHAPAACKAIGKNLVENCVLYPFWCGH
jgi:hypothetical protein